MAKVKLDWKSRCQKCGKLKESTKQRTYRAKGYIGPCGDSFCYASCELAACRDQTALVCDECLAVLKG